MYKAPVLVSEATIMRGGIQAALEARFTHIQDEAATNKLCRQFRVPFTPGGGSNH